MAKQKTLFKTQYNGPHPSMGEINRLPSATVPDQTMTIPELLERHSRGLNISHGKVPVFDESEEFFPDPSKMDLADREAYAEQLRDELEDINQKVAAQRKKQLEEQEAARKQAREDREYIKRQRKKQETQSDDIDIVE